MDRLPTLFVIITCGSLRVWSGGTLVVCIVAALTASAGSVALWPSGWILALPWGVMGGIAAGMLWSHVVLPKAAQGHRRLLVLAAGWGAVSGLAAAAVIYAGVLAVIALAALVPSVAASTLVATCPPLLALPDMGLALAAGALLGFLLAMVLHPRRNSRIDRVQAR